MPATTTTSSSTKPPLWKIWFVAARPHTLPVSVAPNLIAYNAGVAFIDVHDTTSYFWLIVEWTLFCILMQLGTNLHNDYADFVKGADNEKRVGQARATQKGWLTPFQTAMASGLTLLVGLLLGIRFILQMASAAEDHDDEGWKGIAIMVFIVVTSIFNAFAYTGGPWPLGYIGMPNFSLGYSGLGDLFVFLYFGLVATLVPPFLHVACNPGDAVLKDVLWKFAPYSIQVAVLATNIIVVNNLRDRHTDVFANKRTLAVRFGAGFCRTEYAINLLVAYALVLLDATNSSRIRPIKLLPLLSVPLAWKEWQAVSKNEGGALNKHVGGAARLQFVFSILLAVSIRKGN
mmetsp:Transcript_4041/g.9635  ORF Transcript_4041/g.9635 Transcript_4041/m.9635 type:complete len:345 (+) Transcript_4041:94-1128(+)